jgi:NAD(P)-dependent dehydrogenase (short-subunit alcohol dehydrogenase family)
MRDLAGRVAVVTGAASGVGRAMAERFGAEGMRVVLADVEAPVLAATADELRADGLEVVDVQTDVSDFSSVEALRDRALHAFGAVHVLCNNAGVGAGTEGHMWEYDLNDWRWAFDVNVWGVIHGIKAFVPSMLAHGEPGHVVNTSSGNGGLSPLPATPVYATSKAAVVTITECLYAQLREVDAAIGASVLFPGPKMLRTGLFESWRNRPASYAPQVPRRTAPTTIESFEKRMADAGVALDYTPVEEVADRVVFGIRDEQFWILAPSDGSDEQIKARAASMLDRANPSYLRDLTARK